MELRQLERKDEGDDDKKKDAKDKDAKDKDGAKDTDAAKEKKP